jgi:Na+-driven multidrug efflux pump|eukprot:COSAG01_NODE_1394_length_10482_cov_127.211211_15_plen_229_part_00
MRRILLTSSDWPYIFRSAFGAVITTLGSRYIGEKDGARFRRLGLVLCLVALAIGAASGAVAILFSDAIFAFFTRDKSTLALLEKKEVVVVFILSFVIALLASVPDGMVVAAQQFKMQAAIYVSGLLLVYIPIVIYAVEFASASLSWLYCASACYTAWKFLGVAYCAMVVVPRQLRDQEGGCPRELAHHQPTGVRPRYVPPLGARVCDTLLFGAAHPSSGSPSQRRPIN